MNENERAAPSSDLLRTFVAIAESGNLTQAADRLHRTQSAISVQLRKLEEDLKVSLFDRSPRGMSLTECGEKLLPVAQSVLTEIGRARALFETPLTGRLRIGIPDDFDEAILERTLGDFARRHPGVDVLAVSGCTSGFPAAIESGELDIAVCSGRDEVVGEVFATEANVWAVAGNAPLEDWSPLPLALLDRNCWWRELPLAALAAQGRDYKIAFKSSSFAGLKAAVRAGFALGVLPKHSLEKGMKALTEKDGFPDLPVSKRGIAISEAAPPAAVAMAEAIKGAY